MSIRSEFKDLYNPKLINQQEHSYLYQERDRFAAHFNLPVISLVIRESLSDIIDGSAGFGRVYLTNELLNMYPKNPKVANFLIGHEMAHLVFKDYGWKVMKNFYLSIFSHKARAISILAEIRADVMSAIYGSLSQGDHIEIHKLLSADERYDKAKQYKLGYPTRDERVEYSLICMGLLEKDCLSRKSFSQCVIKPLLESYCTEFALKGNRKRRLLESVEEWFWQDCNQMFLEEQVTLDEIKAV